MSPCPCHTLRASEVVGWWTADPWVIGALSLSTVIYARGVGALWRRAGFGRGVRPWEVACYAAGMVTLIAALLSPLDRLSDLLFSAHMGQHELLILVAPPLLVLGRPFVAAPWAFGERGRAAIVSTAQRPRVRAVWRAATHPVAVVVAHAVVLWIWHVPQLFEAALQSEVVHAIQHLGFFVTAALFFWALSHGRYGRLGYGVAVVFVFLTAAHSSALGALLTVLGRVLYPTYAETAPRFGVDALDDQRLAGLLMWIPAGVVFIVVALSLLVAWLGEASRRVERWEDRA